MPSAWITHVKSVYAKGKSKGMTYKQAMISAKSSYKKGNAAKSEEAPKKRRRKKKSKKVKKSEEDEE